ncbi:hypothetical protein HJC23_009287 [Cyclotella cryptica]|uniref:Uncharacterized protein n=1 Tax=Cyclotella cryptica TaxID=29204 RepID=A0ABD3QSY5_9STRA
MSSNGITQSREQLKLQTSRLIQKLESTWNHDLAFQSPSSEQSRSLKRNGANTARQAKFELVGNRVALKARASPVSTCSSQMHADNSIVSLLADENTPPSKAEHLGTKLRIPSSRHVTFSSDVNFTSSRYPTKTRRCTPHKPINTGGRVVAMSPARTLSTRKTSSLLQTGAVRVNVAYYTNPRRKINPGSTRLIESGAVRKVVSRHTTPRKLIGNRHMWSPPPSTGRLKLRDLNLNTPPKSEVKTPLRTSFRRQDDRMPPLEGINFERCCLNNASPQQLRGMFLELCFIRVHLMLCRVHGTSF